jgi:hypothetical protein
VQLLRMVAEVPRRVPGTPKFSQVLNLDNLPRY